MKHHQKFRTAIVTLLTTLALFGCATHAIEPVPIRGPVDGVIAAAAEADGAFNIPHSPYYKAPAPDGSDSPTLILLPGFRTYQQTSEVSCAAASMLMALAYLNGDDPSVTEDGLARELDTRSADNPREDGSYGVATKALAQAFRNRGFQVTSSADTQNEAGYSFSDVPALTRFIIGSLRRNAIVLVEDGTWGGHWRIIIGFDDMGTATIADDVFIFADPYDSTDHCQDGLVVGSVLHFFHEWADGGVLPPDERIQQYVAVSR